MNMLKKLTFLILIVAMLVSCASVPQGKGQPSWLDNPYDKAFDESTYLCAVGSGSTRQRAVDAALSSLSQVFNSQVKSITEVTSLSTSATDMQGNVTFTDASEMVEMGTVTSKTDQIIGAEVVSVHTDALGRVYARVALHRKRTADLYQSQIRELATSIAQQRMALAKSTDPLRQYVTMLGVRDLARQQQSLLDQIQVLLKQPQQQVFAPIQRELTALAQAITIQVLVDADEKSSTALQSAFEKGLQNLGFQVGSDQAVSLLKVTYRVEPIVLADSPYRYARYVLTAQLKGVGATYVSYEKSEREAAMAESDAVARALRAAAGNGVDEFFTLMLSTLGDET
jgi:hypothetical protein